MRWSRFRSSIIATLLALPLASCGQAQGILSPSGERGSWISPVAATSDLIYASANAGNAVYIFSYPAGSLVGTIVPPKGTLALQGLCSDKSGNVFVTASAIDKYKVDVGYVYEYGHGEKTIKRTIGVGRNRPFGCAVDSSENLAVATTRLGRYYGGGLFVFYLATNYGGYGFYYGGYVSDFYSCAYDDNGNLFVNARALGKMMYLEELKSGQHDMQQLNMKKFVSVSGMGQLQWSGGYLTLEDLTASSIYRLSISGSDANVVGTTHLNGWYDAALSAIAGSTVLVPTGNSGSKIGFWNYPAGGSAVKEISAPGGVFALTFSGAAQH